MQVHVQGRERGRWVVALLEVLVPRPSFFARGSHLNLKGKKGDIPKVVNIYDDLSTKIFI